MLVTDPLSEEGLLPLKLAENMEVIVDTGLSEEALLERIKDVDALLVRSQTDVTKAVIESAEQLKIIGRAGVGVDNIDLTAATENGVVVVNAPDGNINSAAEHTMAMLMSLARKIPQAFYKLKNKKWDRKTHIGVEVRGKLLGIVGLGRIGTEVATRAKGQRMNVIAYDPFLTEERAETMGIRYGTLDEVLKTADFITIHTPLLKETRHMIDEEAFGKMKDGVRIINCARGGVLSESALYDAITSGKVAGAAIDVFEEEPATENKLLELTEVIATPHLGASTIEAQESVAIDVGHDVVNILNGGIPRNPVNIPSVPQEVMRKIEPYFYLAEKLGMFLAQMQNEVVEEFNLYYGGELSETNVAPITHNALKGLLKYHLGDRVNEVNAKYLAKKKGIIVHELKTASARGFTNIVTAEIKTKSGRRSVVGTMLNGLGPRIVRIDNYSMDVIPEGHMLLVHHKDQPGAIGRVGTKLAENNVNIATMQVGRSEVGGDAIMMLIVDKPTEDLDVGRLLDLPDIYQSRSIDL